MFSKNAQSRNGKGEGLITLTNANVMISEEFRSLRTNIQFSMINKSLRSLMVTSAEPGEGKSTIAANVAIVFASQGQKVLLIDADMRNPNLNKIFRVPNHRGLSTLLKNEELTLQAVSYSTPQKNLSLLTSGALPVNPSELLASSRMERLIEILKAEFDLLIFDLPPIIAVTDAQVLANKTDGTIFVVRRGVAEKKNLLKAKLLLEHAHANVIGIVFNGKKRLKRKGYGYYNDLPQRRI